MASSYFSLILLITLGGNFKIFLLVRFYVKSILENLHKKCLFYILGALNCVTLTNYKVNLLNK